MIDRNERFLFVGVGGMGMAPLACWMSQAGYSVFGYDLHLQESVRKWLSLAGVELSDFVFPEKVSDFTTLVYSSAVAQSHPLLLSAQLNGLRVMRRGELLAQIAEEHKLIAVVGSHGKTTTSGMVAHGIQCLGLEANYILGGLFADGETPPSHFAESPWLVAEVDESDGTIDGFSPEVTVVLNLDWDHADQYSEATKLREAFSRLAERTRSKIILPQDLELEIPDRIECIHFEGSMKEMGLITPPSGCFNAVNADAATVILSLLSEELPSDMVSSFPGMLRRQVCLFRSEQIVIVEDYAHHPTEIDVLIDSLRKKEPGRRLVVVFQPHRYTRTRQFKSEFASSLSAADAVYLLPVYAAHEPVLEGGDSQALAAAFSNAPAELRMDLLGVQALLDLLRDEPAQIAFVGAGDIEEFAAVFTSWVRSSERLSIALLDYLQQRLSPDCIFKEDEPLAKKTTIRIGGAARFYAEPANLSDLRVLIRAAKLYGLETFFIGRGSNLLVSDDGFDGIVIRFSGAAWRQVESLGEGRIWAAAGGRLKEICGFAAKSGLAGFEFLEGIPGAIGGALRMNAGAMGSWMFDVVERVQFIDEWGVYQDLPKDAFHFGYRKVEEISRGVALGAILRSANSEEEACIRDRIDNYSSSRKESQPRGASAGCIFKNPDGNYAGKLIDEYGIKGMRVGGAEVSDVHGNFIVNLGGASASDVIALVKQIRAKVKAESGYILEPEVLLVGQSWDEVLSE